MHFISMVEFQNILVPDNLKAAVINKKGIVKLNDAYADMARTLWCCNWTSNVHINHKIKVKVELGVKAIQRWILMRLRHHTFFSVDQLNEEIK